MTCGTEIAKVYLFRFLFVRRDLRKMPAVLKADGFIRHNKI